MGDSLTEKLLEKRDGYEAELEWHKFLLDAYAGTGGFAGRIKQPDEDRLGWGASAYDTCCSTTNTTSTTQQPLPDGTSIGNTIVRTYETYLDAFPREDDAKFRRRIDIAHYVNYTGPICDLYAGYLSSVDPSREGVEDGAELADWMQDCDGRGTSWDELKETVLIPCALDLGWCPVIFDADTPPEDAEVKSKLDEQKLKLRARAVPLAPANILKWEADDGGTLKWVKYKIDYCEQADPLGDEVEYSKVWIWTRTDFSVYRIDKGAQTATVEIENRPHNFGAVPMVVFRASKAPGDPVRGMSAVGAVAIENRRHFNLMSELDEHLRSTVFALLQVPVPPGATPPDNLVTGNGNAVPVPSDASQGYGFIAPPQSVADTYENRLAASAREIYRVAQAPYEVDSGAPTSGIAYAYKFEGTNKRLVKIAKGIASAEQRALQLVGKSLGMGDDKLNAIRVEAPQGFLVNDISVDLDNLIKAISLKGMSATAKMIAISRSVQKMVPNMTAEQRKAIDAELEQLKDADLQAAAPTDKGTVGAQTDAIIKVNDEINAKQIPHETGVAIVVSVMGLTPEDAEKVLVPEGFVPAPKVPAEPFGKAPTSQSDDGETPPEGDGNEPPAEDEGQQEAA